MALTVNISLDVPDLPDDDVWFANAAAWTEYWRDISVEATFDAVANSLYAETNYDTSLMGVTITDDTGAQHSLATVAIITSLLARLDTLNTSYKTLRDELKVAGLLENSQ